MPRLLPIVLLLLLPALPAQAVAPPLRPFPVGTSWTFRSGFFNGALAAGFARSLTSILIFTRTGHTGGRLTLSVTQPEEKGPVLLHEVYDYPEAGTGSGCPEAVQAAAPPEARAYEIRETTHGKVTMTTLVGNMGSPQPEYLHLLPVQPQAPMQWHWNTSQATFILGALTEEQAQSGVYNAHGQVISTTAIAHDRTGPVEIDRSDSDESEEGTCTHVKITVNEIETYWWFSPTLGLVRYGGANLGPSREQLAIPDPDDPKKKHPMDQRVFMR